MSEIATIVAAIPFLERACRVRAVGSARGGPLTAKQARTLEQLDTVDPVMVTELAEYLGVTASTMSLNLKRLEGAGLVRRSRDPDDARVMNVVLTDLGAEARDRARSIDPQRVAALLDRLRPEERRGAAETLARLSDAARAAGLA